MTLDWTRAIPAALLFLLGGAYMSNEWSHGEVSDALGFGHHHLHDVGPDPCPPQPSGQPPTHDHRESADGRATCTPDPSDPESGT